MTLEEQLSVFIDFSPSHIQRHFACDCAERALLRFNLMDARLWNIAKISRLFAEGKATDKQLSLGWEMAQSIILGIPVEDSVAAYYAVRNTAQIDAKFAARDTSWACSWGITIFTERYSDKDLARIQEIEWQMEHMWSLLAAYDEARLLLLSALLSRAESIKPVFEQYAQSLEEKVFE